MTVEVFLKSLPVLVFFMVLVFQTGGTIYMILQHGRDIRNLEKDLKESLDKVNKQFEIDKAEVNRRLYNQESMPIFVPTTRCDEIRGGCANARQKEYDHLAETIREQGKKEDQLTRLIISFL